MALVFKTPKSALNTTSKDIQNLSSDCPPCPEVKLTTADVEYTENGSFTVTPESGFDGLSQVDITVNIDTQAIEDAAYAEGEAAGETAQKAKLISTTITQNGTSTREDGWNSVTVNVQPTLQAKTATPTTSQQVITADSGNDGLSQVTVNAVTSSIDANITAGNIKKDVSILGVTGSYDPQPDLETKSVTYTANDTYTITPTTGKDGMSSVEVTVNVTGSNCPDWSSIGWDCNDVENSKIETQLADAVNFKEQFEANPSAIVPANLEFIPKITLPSSSCDFLFANKKAKYWPTSFDGQPTSAYDMFADDYLDHIPSFDMSEITNASGMFRGINHTFKTANISLPKATNVTNLFLRDFSAPASSSLTSATIYAPLATRAEQILYGHSRLTELNLTLGTLSGVNRYIFARCTSLQSVPLIDTSLATDLGAMFWGCSSLTTVPLYDFSSATRIDDMFSDCTALVSIPQFNTSNVNTIGGLFTNCTSLTTIPLLDFSKVTSFTGSIRTTFYNCTSLTTLGGFLNAGKAFTGADAAYQHILDLSSSTVLTKESIMNVINNLAAPDDTAVTDATLKLSATSYALLTAEDIAIATAKNWTVTS